MLTVNLCDNGCQRTIEAVEVRGCSNNSLMHYDEAQIDMPDGRILSVTTGCVFVMNESGATVAKYDFPPEGANRSDDEPASVKY